ncbi:hypothetical protein FCL47_02705 [Desulfopila sp. IMCC35006]|uniref:hypothetical protein n=1 Tax=Desulfopila sp. IMCC35006 TaxID=2569542 RepID=UPI0010AC8086|nr:hypothetical protein [Desulfopila sp. IMCC35006]TKB28414.1 hypothetical protein FCL47_02705 [Desulfopila sp. IMCC35006]
MSDRMIFSFPSPFKREGKKFQCVEVAISDSVLYELASMMPSVVTFCFIRNLHSGLYAPRVMPLIVLKFIGFQEMPCVDMSLYQPKIKGHIQPLIIYDFFSGPSEGLGSTG